MSDDQKPKAPSVPASQIVRLIIGMVLFGVLMGLREDFQSVWMRMLIAGCAGGAIGIFILPLRKYRG
jgi:hypothetical protein